MENRCFASFFIDIIMYNELLGQYNNLTEEEKESLFVYKTQFYDLINSVTAILDFKELDTDTIIKIIDKRSLDNVLNFGRIISKPNNMIIKYSYFNDVNFNDYDSIIRKVIKVYDDLSGIINSRKMILSDDVTVYRVVSLSNGSELKDISRGDFVSTSMDLDKALEFISENNINIYKINLKAGTPVIATPYSIVNVYPTENDKLLRTSNYNIMVSKTEAIGQQEVLLSKKCLDYDLIPLKSDVIDGRNIFIYDVDTKLRNYNRTN